VGNIAGPLLAYEIMTAFFLEAVFLGIMLFGFRRVPGWLHTLATVPGGGRHDDVGLLDPGAQQLDAHAAGLRDARRRGHATDWWAIIFNPSMPYRLIHMLLASGLTVAFLIAGISALRWLMATAAPSCARRCASASGMGALLIPLQIFMGDMHGLNTLEHQPAKVAAMEGNWETRGNVPLVLFALPGRDNARRTASRSASQRRQPDPQAPPTAWCRG
jgi:cytochrome bd ubiquinol oxidase subunit I